MPPVTPTNSYTTSRGIRLAQWRDSRCWSDFWRDVPDRSCVRFEVKQKRRHAGVFAFGGAIFNFCTRNELCPAPALAIQSGLPRSGSAVGLCLGISALERPHVGNTFN